MLATGMGSLDWQALPLACAYHGARDVEMLIHRLLAIKAYRPPAQNES